MSAMKPPTNIGRLYWLERLRQLENPDVDDEFIGFCNVVNGTDRVIHLTRNVIAACEEPS